MLCEGCTTAATRNQCVKVHQVKASTCLTLSASCVCNCELSFPSAHTLQISQEFQSTSGLPNNYLMPETRAPVLQLINKFPALCGTHNLTTFFTTARH